MEMRWEGFYNNSFFGPLKTCYDRVYVLNGGGPKDSGNTPYSFWSKNKEKVFWQIGTDMLLLEQTHLEHYKHKNKPFVV